MLQTNDLSRSFTALNQDNSLIVVIVPAPWNVVTTGV